MAGVAGNILSEGLKRGKIERPPGAIRYARFRESFRGVERGTVIAGRRVIWGFPHIKRIFTLENGLKRNISAEWLYAEEKIDGFNVRVAFLGGEVFAFSRGGFLDSFVTEKARDMGLEKYFRAHPEHVLCGEMVGNTPYTPPAGEFDVRLFVFDIDMGDGSYMPCRERHALLKRYGIVPAPLLGRFKSDDYAGLRKLALSLNKARREGMVLKSEDRAEAVKYVTPWSDIDDVARNSRLLFDMPIGFYYQRILRSAFFIGDFGMDQDEHSKKLGKAFYGGLMGAIKDAKAGREIDEEFEISVRNPGIWEDIRGHMSREVRLEELWRREEGKRTRIRFRKIYKRTTRLLGSYAGGKGVTD